jgi:ATP-binding cassette, subfamily C, bacterial CydD
MVPTNHEGKFENPAVFGWIFPSGHCDPETIFQRQKTGILTEYAKKAREKQAGKWLQNQVNQVKGLLWLSAGAGVMASLCVVLQCFLLANLLVDLAVENHFNRSFFWFLAIPLFLRPFFLSVKDLSGTHAGRVMRRRLRKNLLEKIMAAGPHRSRIAGDGSLSAMVLEQVDAMDDYIVRYLPQKILAIATPIIIVVAVLPHSLLVALLLAATAPLIPFFMHLVGNEAARAGRRQFQALSLLADRIRTLLQGLHVLRQLNAVEPARDDLEAATDRYRKKTLSVLRMAFLSSAVLELFASLAIALVAVYLGMGLLGYVPWARGTIPVSLSAALFILLLIPEFYLALRRLGADYHAKAQAMAAAASIMPLLETSIKRSSGGTRIWQPDKAPRICMEQVTWQPHGRNMVLQEINLDIQPGERVGLTGPSGAGKTSLLQLILGFDLPTKGRIMVDGQPLGTLALDAFRKQIAWLGQRPEWFSGTVARNLRLADPHARETDLEQALQAAGAWDFIHQLPRGIHTDLGEGGRGFSGGQLQRLALARALLQDAWLWILDEPGAHLDSDTATSVRRHLGRVSQGKTLILAAHHLEGLEWLDRLVKIEEGRILSRENIGQ